jgi:inositol oxygenase
MNDKDRGLFEWVKKFNPYDLYSKSAERPKTDEVRPYYNQLISEYFPEKLAW